MSASSILGAAAYRDQFARLLPPGAAWPRDPGAVLGQLLAGLAEEFARLDARAAVLLDEADPLTALELLPEWERLAGLPDACFPGGEGVRDRQVAVARKVSGLGGQSRAFLVELAERIGVEVAIEEFAPFDCNSSVDAELADDAWRPVFLVRTLSTSASSDDAQVLRFADFTTESGCDEALRTYGIIALECVIERARPAHTVALFAYPEDPEPVFRFDFITGA